MKKISKPSWKKQLNQALKTTPVNSASKPSASEQRQPLRLALLGIGNELDGDDAAGVWAARSLQPRLAHLPQVLVLDAGPAPENFTAPLRRFQPDLVIIIDAAHLDAAPGTIAWVDWQDTAGLSASSHSLPPSVLARFLTQELGCRVTLLAIQALRLDFFAPLSAPVETAVQEICLTLVKYLSPSIK